MAAKGVVHRFSVQGTDTAGALDDPVGHPAEVTLPVGESEGQEGRDEGVAHKVFRGSRGAGRVGQEEVALGVVLAFVTNSVLLVDYVLILDVCLGSFHAIAFTVTFKVLETVIIVS